ncbi:helix-turn-helix transcriptional regulator [Vibrio crassostreae]|uniref:helix-turn-helix transcriptional regulator n=1 Tax=Vibrio crassostreae TaxID=246167 RepID=UPI001B30A7CD|nr:AraC family transcriptional regulator [Vibrio crassostreae]
MNSPYFIRVNSLMRLHSYMLNTYYTKLSLPQSIPQTAFARPSNLLPVSEVYKLFEEFERDTQNPDFMIEAIKHFKLEELNGLGKWMFSGHDLMSSIRKINYGMRCFQSGAHWVAAPSGSIIKWSYNNLYDAKHLNVHDSIRVAVLMLKVLQKYLGEQFIPMRVMLSGEREDKALYRDHFGTDITWNHHQTEIWFHSSLRLTSASDPSESKHIFSLSFDDLDLCLDMPHEQDETKLVYEVINYSCHFGLPTLTRVSAILGLSTQQFQRRFHKYGHNFTEMCGYVLSNKAVKMLSNSVSVEEVARTLGYSRLDSFTHMFKKHRGVTPKQFLRSLEC